MRGYRFTKKYFTYFKNMYSFMVYSSLKIFFRRKKNGDKLLLVNLATIGDLIISSVFFKNEKVIPHKEIHFLIQKQFYDIFKDYAGIIKVLCVNYSFYKWIIPYRIYFLIRLRKNNYHTAVNLAHNRFIPSDEISLLSGANRIIAVSLETRMLPKLFKGKINKEYNHIYYKDKKIEIEKYLDLIRLWSGEIPSNETIFFLNEQTKKNIELRYNFCKNHNVITIGISASNKLKIWQLENYVKLISKLIKNKRNIVILLGISKDRKAVSEITNKFYNGQIINLTGRLSIRESAALINISKLYIGNDSGLLHIAKALKVPTIGIVGGGSFGLFHPYNNDQLHKLVYNKLDCFGCEWICKYNNPLCITEVSTDDVIQCIKSIPRIRNLIL